MPTLPSNTKCGHLGCKNPRTKYSSLCLEHGGRDTQAYKSSSERIEANAMYQTNRWSKLRARFLSMQPLCQSCLTRGIVTMAKDIDHVFPWRKIGKHAFYSNYYQCLCHECHASKTQLEKKGICVDFRGNSPVEYRVEEYTQHTQFFLET